MWKLILILVLVIYLLNKISVVLFRAMGRPQGRPPNSHRGHNDIHANATERNVTKPGNIKGGEYVDYEEVK